MSLSKHHLVVLYRSRQELSNFTQGFAFRATSSSSPVPAFEVFCRVADPECKSCEPKVVILSGALSVQLLPLVKVKRLDYEAALPAPSLSAGSYTTA